MELFNKVRNDISIKQNESCTIAIVENFNDVTKVFDSLEHGFEVQELTLQYYPEYKLHEDHFKDMFGVPLAYYKVRASDLDIEYYLDEDNNVCENCGEICKTTYYLGVVQFANCVLCVAPRTPLEDEL
jgi:hypothetical protein